MKWLFGSVFGIMAAIFLMIGCPFLMVAGGFYYFVEYRTSDWVPATGVVTGLSQTQSTDSEGFTTTMYCPSVEFATSAGETIEVDVNDCSSPPAYATGDALELKYNPADPREVQLKGGTLQTLTVVFGIVFGGLGALLVIAAVVLGFIGVIVMVRRNSA